MFESTDIMSVRRYQTRKPYERKVSLQKKHMRYVEKTTYGISSWKHQTFHNVHMLRTHRQVWISDSFLPGTTDIKVKFTCQRYEGVYGVEV